MADSWRQSTIGAEADLLLGFAFKSSAFAIAPSGYRLVRGDNVKRGVIEWGDKTRYWRELTPDLEKYALKPGDVVVGMDGSRIGENYACISNGDLPAYLVQRVACLRARSTLDQGLLRYLICNPIFTAYIKAVQTGTSIPHVSGSQIGAYPIAVPPKREQKAIAHILGTLDDKIDLNRRMAATLEEMARAVFKAWFVDFEPVRAKRDGRGAEVPLPLADLLPDRFIGSDVGEVPSGWVVTTIGEIAEIVDCLHSKKPERRDTGKPLIQLWNIPKNGVLDLNDAYLIDDLDYQKWTSRFEASPGDCVITNVGRVGAVAQIPAGVKAALGRNMTGIRCRRDFPFPTFVLECLRSDWMTNEISRKTDAGTILDALNVRNIPRLRFVRGDRNTLEYFERTVRPFRRRIEEALAESRNLMAIRDTLLPKLISGALRVKDAERFVGQRA